MKNRTSLHTDLLDMNISWLLEDLELFENSFDLTISLVFTLARSITFILAVIVHRAFYKLMKRLPGRAVNQIIYPYMVRDHLTATYVLRWFWKILHMISLKKPSKISVFFKMCF